MPKLKEDYTKQEKINGVVYNMSPSANYRHSIVNGNIYGKHYAKGIKIAVYVLPLGFYGES